MIEKIKYEDEIKHPIAPILDLIDKLNEIIDYINKSEENDKNK